MTPNDTSNLEVLEAQDQKPGRLRFQSPFKYNFNYTAVTKYKSQRLLEKGFSSKNQIFTLEKWGVCVQGGGCELLAFNAPAAPLQRFLQISPLIISQLQARALRPESLVFPHQARQQLCEMKR